LRVARTAAEKHALVDAILAMLPRAALAAAAAVGGAKEFVFWPR